MKGLKKDMSAIVRKGTGRVEVETDYMVGGELIFTECYLCSPGADHGFNRLNLLKPLRRQEDIVLEEYDRTKIDRYGSGTMDTCQVIDLEERFIGMEDAWDRWSKFTATFYLFGICNPEEIIPDWAIARQESLPEGRVFIVYSLLKEDYELAKKTASFMEAVKKILAEGQVAKEVQFLCVSRSTRYAPSVWLSHTEWTDAYCYRLSGSYLEQDKTYSFPLGGMGGLVHLVVKDHKVDWVHNDTTTFWADSQYWWWVVNLPPVMEEGRIIIDGKDVANDVLAWREEYFLAERAKKEERTRKFEAARDLVLDRFDEELVRAASACPKGQKIQSLQILAETDASREVVLHYLTAGAYGAVLANCLSLESAGVSKSLARKLAQKAFAWRYLSNAGLEIESVSYGNFNEAIEALSLYGQGEDSSWGYKTLAEALKRAGF